MQWEKERKEKGKVVRKSGESSKRMREKRSERKSGARQVVKEKGRQVINEREEQKWWEKEKDARVREWRKHKTKGKKMDTHARFFLVFHALLLIPLSHVCLK